jgi:hypothetical protein
MASADPELERLLEEGSLTAPRASNYAQLFLVAVPNGDVYSKTRLAREFQQAMLTRDPELIDRYGPLESLYHVADEQLLEYARTLLVLLSAPLFIPTARSPRSRISLLAEPAAPAPQRRSV